MSAIKAPVGIAEFDQNLESLNTTEASLGRALEPLPDAGVFAAELCNEKHRARRYVLANMASLTLRADVSAVGRRVGTTPGGWRARRPATLN